MKNFNKVYGSVSLLFALFFSFLAGMAASHRWYQAMSIDLTVVVAWVTFGLVAFAQYVDSERTGIKTRMLKIVEKSLETLEKSKELVKTAESAVDNAMKALDNAGKQDSEKAHAEELAATMAQIIEKITGGGRPPKGAEIKKAQDEFHKQTDHWGEIKPVGKDEVAIIVHNHPFEATKRATQRKDSQAVNKKKSTLTPAKKG